MPQMFPMPFTLLMVMVGVLFMTMIIRAYWYNLSSTHPIEGAGTKSYSSYSQTW